MFEHSISTVERERYAKDAQARYEKDLIYMRMAENAGDDEEAAFWLDMSRRDRDHANYWSKS